jgi:surface protein
MDRTIIELMDDMHLSSRDLFLNYYYAMQSNNVSSANSILLNNPSLANQITNSQNVNYLINGVNEREIEPKRDIDYYLDKLYQDFLVMINNTRVRGDFDSTVQYYPHNLVYYNGKGYYALKEPPIGTLPTNTEYWLEFDIRGFQGYGGLDLNLKFNWDNTISYKKGDIVIYRNKMWYALADNTNYEPNLNHYPWVIISMPKMANKTPIQRATPTGYDTGDFWFQITLGDDVIQKKWDVKQQEITPRFASAGFVIGDNIYTTGGITQTFVRSNKTEVFDTVTNTWSAKADAPTTRARTAAFSIGNKAYVIGGVDSNGNILDTVEEYDSDTNTWTAKQSLPIPLVTSGIAVNNIGYVVAGETTGNQTVGNAYSYNSTTDTWTAITDKLTPTYGHALASDGTNIYAMGGINQNGDTIGLNEAYDIATNTWSEKDDMLVPRSFLSSFFTNGSIYAVGGLNSDWYSLDTNEKYNIEENQWTTDTPMNYPRSSLNAMAIGTKGYSIGGINIATSDVHGYTEEYQVKDITSNYDMVIDTTLDSTGSKTVSIPMVLGGTYDYWIDWGDGTSSTQITAYNDTNATHTYVADGEYTIRLIGTLDQLEYTGNIAACLKEVTKCNLAFSVIKNMFKGCTNLTNVVESIFSQTTMPTTAESVFEGCSKFGMIPVGLFDNMSGILSFKNTFKGTSIINIPTGLFDSNNSATDFSGVFENCTRLVAIPMNLFKNNTSATTFANAFMGDIALTELPNTLFNNNVEVITYENVFSGCTGIKELPINLFGDGALSVINFSGALYNVPLTSLPAGLFRQAYSATNYDNVFNFYGGNIPANCFSGDNATYENALDVEGIEEIGDNGLNGLALSSDMFSGQDQASALITLGNDALWSKNATSIANQPTQMFFRNTTLTTIGNINFKPITETMGGMFYGCTSLENVSGFFYGDNNKPSLSVDITFENSPLTHTSLLNISDSLVVQTPTTIKNLTLGATNLAKLSVDEKMIIINKYWKLVGYDISKDIQAAGGYGAFAMDMVQKLKGDSSTKAEELDFGSYPAETNLYYYVGLVNKITSKQVAIYAFEKSTGIFYDPDLIPVQEYHIWHNNIGTHASPVFLSKTLTGDPDGTILKNYLSNNDTEDYYEIIIGDKYDIGLKTAGLENIKNATQLFINLQNVRTLYIEGDFKPETMVQTFEGVSNLTTLNFDNFDTSNCTSMEGTFSGLTTFNNWNFLNSLDTSKVKNMSNLFAYSSTLTEMPTFSMASVEDASYMFEQTGISKIKPNILGSNIKTAEGMFSLCTNLDLADISDYTTIFGHNNNLTNVSHLFEMCSKVSTVGIHDVFTYVEDPTGMEPGGYELDQTKLNNQLFTYCPNITDMSYILEDTGITSIPMGLFYHCPKLTTVMHAFGLCQKIATGATMLYMSQVLFTNNPELKDISFLFYNAKITGFITENIGYTGMLFPGTKIERAVSLWDGCQMTDVEGYETIPFIYNSRVLKDIDSMFANQTMFRELSNMFSGTDDEYSWDNLSTLCPALQNCSYMFSNATQLVGNGNKLVTELSKITTLTSHEKALQNCTKLSDYNSIPSGWK